MRRETKLTGAEKKRLDAIWSMMTPEGKYNRAGRETVAFGASLMVMGEMTASNPQILAVLLKRYLMEDDHFSDVTVLLKSWGFDAEWGDSVSCRPGTLTLISTIKELMAIVRTVGMERELNEALKEAA